jgi:hypothetical protein
MATRKKATTKSRTKAAAPSEVVRMDLARHPVKFKTKRRRLKTGEIVTELVRTENKRVLAVPVEPAPISGRAVTFKPYESAEAEENAAIQDAEAARARLEQLADAVMAGKLPDSPFERFVIASTLRRRAEDIKTDIPKRGRGNPDFKRNAIYDRLLVAVQVEFLMREDHLPQQKAAAQVAGALGRDDADAVRKCHNELREPARQYVDVFGPWLRSRAIR